ncbi:MAG: hypothetical protein NC453_19635 [Muribaculum sp.]|nr:hypothetical protein [Muribaculum sp.]
MQKITSNQASRARRGRNCISERRPTQDPGSDKYTKEGETSIDTRLTPSAILSACKSDDENKTLTPCYGRLGVEIEQLLLGDAQANVGISIDVLLDW